MATDINPMRELLIRAHGLSGMDRPYTLYYDETNNIRRLRVTAEGFNVADPPCFVLGGVGHAGSPRPLDIQGLRQAVGLQTNAKELKLEYLGLGGFLKLLGSRKLTAYLDWVADQHLFVHYVAMDPFYWSCVDIIDAVLTEDSMRHISSLGPNLKNDLYTVLRDDRAATAALFFAFNYPALAPDRRSEFMETLHEWVDARADLLEHFPQQMLKDVLKAGRRVAELPLLEGDEPRTLVAGFTGCFVERITLFKNASHILDDEDVVRPQLQTYDLRDGHHPLANYRFTNSRDEPGVQISDPMAGLIGKLLTYVIYTAPGIMLADRAKLSAAQRGNLRILSSLLDLSVAETPGFSNNVLALQDQRVAAWFLAAGQ